MKLSCSNIKKFLIFSGNGTFLYFLKRKTEEISGNGNPEKVSFIFSKENCSYISGNGSPKKFLILQQTELSYISGNGNPNKTSYISGSNFPCWKSEKNPLLKSFLYFEKWKFLATGLKNFLHFRREFEKHENETKKTCSN